MSSEILSIAQSGMSAAKKSMQTASHNISNVNTEGYSRQRVHQMASLPLGSGNTVIGSGTYIKSIERVHDDFLEKKINSNISENQYNHERHLHLSAIETIFNEINYDGLNSSLNNFFNSFRELSNNPSSETARSLIRENARVLINNFHRSREFLSQTVTNIDHKLDESVLEINNTLDALAKLNVKIRELETTNGESGDLRDERGVLLNKLSEYFSIDTFTDEQGRFVIGAKGIGTLVNGNLSQQFQSISPPDDGDTSSKDFAGAREIFINRKHVSNHFQQGKLGALIETRESEIRSVQNKVDELAWIFANAVNAVHRRGYCNKNVPVDSDGNMSAQDLAKNTGINFFEVPDTPRLASALINLSGEIKSDLSNMVTALEPNSPADNRIALAISKLQHQPLSLDGKRTLEEEYLQAIASLALAVGRFRANSEQSEGLLAQAKFFKETISGVSIDEEATNLMKFQHAFDASARVMRVADEIFKAVLAIKS